MTTLNEGRHAGGFMVSEANGRRSRSVVTLKSGETVVAGQVLGWLTGSDAGEVSVAAVADDANTGNGAITMGSPATGDGVKSGVYVATCLTEASNGGTFQLTDPDGEIVGTATVGTPFNDVLKFTVADGSEDWDIGDVIRFTVTVDTDVLGGEFVAFDQDGDDGSETPRAIAWDNYDASSADLKIVVLARDAEVVGADLVWPEDITGSELAAAIGALAERGIFVR